jgi:putative tricarboxylic transport membrane protein
MFFAGIFGYFLSLCKYPTAPAVLGVILAPMADENLRRSLMIFSEKDISYFFEQYVGLILLAIFIIVIIDGLRRLKNT